MSSNTVLESGGAGFAVERLDGYVRICHGGIPESTIKTLHEFWVSLAEICEKLDCQRILLIGPDPGTRPDTMAAFESGVEAARIVAGRSLAICWNGFKSDEQAEFFKTVAGNRGARIEFFSETEAAVKWLFS